MSVRCSALEFISMHDLSGERLLVVLSCGLPPKTSSSDTAFFPSGDNRKFLS